MINIRKLEAELWESADLLRAESKLTSQEYCMPVLGLIFLRYAYSRFRFVEAEILKDRPSRGGRVMPVEAIDFQQKSALFLPEEARYEYLLNLPDDANIGEKVNQAMELVEEQSEQLRGVLPKTYTSFKNDLLRELLRIFNNSALNDIQDDIIGRIYEYFLNKFAPAVASDDGVFFTPKSLVRMIVNIIEPKRGTVLDPACGSGGMFVSSADFTEQYGANANMAMTFYGQEKVEYNAKLCLMNMAVHGLNAQIVSGDAANSFYNDHFSLEGKCDFVMANPPFNVDKVKSESAQTAGRLPFGLPGVNAAKEVSNGNYLWISYFYSYLNEQGRAGFVMAASATDSSGRDREIRRQLVSTGAVDVMLSVGTNFFYTKSLPCTLWFFDKGKKLELRDKVLFIDSRNYYTAVDRTLNEWSPWQMKNLNAIVWLHRGEIEKYQALLAEYQNTIMDAVNGLHETEEALALKSIAGWDLYHHVEGPCPKYYERDFASPNVRDVYEQLTGAVTFAIKRTAEFVAKEEKKKKKAVTDAAEKLTAVVNGICETIRQYLWLTDKFGDGEYRDIAGLCKAATLQEIEEKNWSLTPGAYVGVEEQQTDDVDFAERMQAIHVELLKLQMQSDELMATISKNWEEMGL